MLNVCSVFITFYFAIVMYMDCQTINYELKINATTKKIN